VEPLIKSNVTSILYIEDNQSDYLYYRDIIKKSFHPQEVFFTLAETLVSARKQLKHQSRFDIILLDLNLPDSSSMDTLRLIKAATKVPIVVMSAQADIESIKSARELGAKGFISKQDKNVNISEHLMKVLAKEPALKPL